MQKKDEKLQALIAKCLEDFYARRISNLQKLKLKKMLARKNPYLYKALGTENASEIVARILSDYVSSSDETIFGDVFFEPIAKAVTGGRASSGAGVDVEVETESRVVAISVKSGPNIFNNSQKQKQDEQFKELHKRLLKLKKHFDPILGFGYGRKRTTSSRWIYRQLAGQEFWQEITGDAEFYKKLIIFIENDVVAKKRDEYTKAWERAVNKYVREFTTDFCLENGAIDWGKLVEYNSGKNPPRQTKRP